MRSTEMTAVFSGRPLGQGAFDLTPEAETANIFFLKSYFYQLVSFHP
jgi:hypothetical protein